MKDIKKNRFLLWLMWVAPISLCGLAWAVVWTVIILMLYLSDKNEYEKKKVPVWKDEKIIEMNKDISLDEDYTGLVKIKEGIYIYQRKR